jgi:UV DNA damage endonuclease
MPPKRKRSFVASVPAVVIHETPILPPGSVIKPPPPKRQASRRGKVDTNPDHNADIVDGKTALRASPDADELGEAFDTERIVPGPKISVNTNGNKRDDSESSLSDIKGESPAPTPAKKQKKTPTKSSIAAKKASDEIKAFRAEQAANKATAPKIKMEDREDEWDKRLDPDGDDVGPVEDAEALKLEAARPPPVNSDFLPLPWKGRLGYVSLWTVYAQTSAN